MTMPLETRTVACRMAWETIHVSPPSQYTTTLVPLTIRGPLGGRKEIREQTCCCGGFVAASGATRVSCAKPLPLSSVLGFLAGGSSTLGSIVSCLFLGSGSDVFSAARFRGDDPGALRTAGFSCLKPSCGLGDDALGSRDPRARLLGEASITAAAVAAASRKRRALGTPRGSCCFFGEAELDNLTLCVCLFRGLRVLQPVVKPQLSLWQAPKNKRREGERREM